MKDRGKLERGGRKGGRREKGGRGEGREKGKGKIEIESAYHSRLL